MGDAAINLSADAAVSGNPAATSSQPASPSESAVKSESSVPHAWRQRELVEEDGEVTVVPAPASEPDSATHHHRSKRARGDDITHSSGAIRADPLQRDVGATAVTDTAPCSASGASETWAHATLHVSV
jgi:hypothetical protein